MDRLAGAFLLLLALAAPAFAQTLSDNPTYRLFATQVGEPAYDNDPSGGNPFASALVSALDERDTSFLSVLYNKTLENSYWLQEADLPDLSTASAFRPEGDTAQALVIVFADYGDEEGLNSLPGAVVDAVRVTQALAKNGFETELVIAADSVEYRSGLSRFASSSEKADHAVIYTTGHGSEVDGEVYLFPPDIDEAGIENVTRDNLSELSIPLEEVEAALHGRTKNWVLYAGCRDNPFGL